MRSKTILIHFFFFYEFHKTHYLSVREHLISGLAKFYIVCLGTVAFILSFFYLLFLLHLNFDFLLESFMSKEKRRRNHCKHYYKMKQKIWHQFCVPKLKTLLPELNILHVLNSLSLSLSLSLSRSLSLSLSLSFSLSTCLKDIEKA